MPFSLSLSLSISIPYKFRNAGTWKGRVRKIKVGSNKLMGCVYMKCFSLMPLALRAKNKSFAIHWFQLLLLYKIMIHCMMRRTWTDFTHSQVIVKEDFCFCFEGLDTGQHKKTKQMLFFSPVRKRNAVQYLTSTDPITVPDTVCMRKWLCVHVNTLVYVIILCGLTW